ncbi:hypothetical protein LPJ60_006285, partial [Coemansia sp. RSA 2675]
MDLHRSTFETLPMLIVHRVVEYIVGGYKNSAAFNVDELNKYKGALVPLLNSSDDENLILQFLCTAPNTAILQRLEFGRQFYSADDIIKVLAALPSLVHLSCGIRELQAEILAIPVSERPSGLRQKYYPLSKNFRTLSVAYPKDGVLTEDVAYAAMPIAVLCPNFAQVDLPTEQRRNFGCEIAKIYVDSAFKP